MNDTINEEKYIKKKNEELIEELKKDIENLIVENNEIKNNLKKTKEEYDKEKININELKNNHAKNINSLKEKNE